MYIIFPSATALTQNTQKQLGAEAFRSVKMFWPQNIVEAQQAAWSHTKQSRRVIVIFGTDDVLRIPEIKEEMQKVSPECWFVYFGQMTKEALPQNVEAVLPIELYNDLVGVRLFFCFADTANDPEELRRFSKPMPPRQQKHPRWPRC